MTTPIAVRVEDLRRAHEDFVEALGAANKQLAEMKNNIGLLGGAWTGGAASAFGTSLQQWCGQFENVNRQLGTMRAKLEEVAAQYNATSALTTDMARGAASRGLPGL